MDLFYCYGMTVSFERGSSVVAVVDTLIKCKCRSGRRLCRDRIRGHGIELVPCVLFLFRLN